MTRHSRIASKFGIRGTKTQIKTAI
jgi:hypothetical protein